MNQDASRWWAGAVKAEWLATINRSADEDWDLKRFDAAMERIKSPRWVPERRPARLPSMWAIASYWAGRDGWFDIILTRPHCFACGLHGGYPEDEKDNAVRWNCANRLQRGHIVNRARHGLDAVQNLVPMCRKCNRHMPVFGVEDEDAALAWIFDGGFVGEVERRLAAKGLA
jgi:hypothetical protein